MLYEAKKDEGCDINPAPVNNKMLFFMAIATSIDALAVGITFALTSVNIYSSITIIGVITFIISVTGVLLGKKFCGLLKNKAEIVGGIILILIGLKILIEGLL